MEGRAQGGLTVLHKSSGNGLGLLNCWPRKQLQELVHTDKRKEVQWCVPACVRACVRACVCVCAFVCSRVFMQTSAFSSTPCDLDNISTKRTLRGAYPEYT